VSALDPLTRLATLATLSPKGVEGCSSVVLTRLATLPSVAAATEGCSSVVLMLRTGRAGQNNCAARKKKIKAVASFNSDSRVAIGSSVE
jgi:hypothetical protein